MPMTFTSSITVTLFFEAWTTTKPSTYVLTLLLLFFLALLNRFLAALRFQFEHSQPHLTHSITILKPPRSRRIIPKARLSPLPQYIEVSHEETDTETDQEHLQRAETDDRSHSRMRFRAWRRLLALCPTWTSNAQWSLRRDGGRALLEGVRTFVGYILMLAVMTFNTGIFCAVLVGIIVGEMVFGRYMLHSSELSRDGDCHG